jgi:hypothetical protein
VSVFIDQACENGPSADPGSVEADLGGEGSVTIVVGDVLRDALVRPGRAAGPGNPGGMPRTAQVMALMDI